MLAVGLAVMASYLAGSLPTSLVICRLLRGIDIREHGSKNAGATNVYRVMGFKVALLVLLIDAGKGWVAVKASAWISPDGGLALAMACGLTAIVGHVWTVFAGFRGGKGVGTALGVFTGLMPLPSLIALLGWVLIVALSRYVSVASMAAGLILFVSAFGFHRVNPANPPLALVAFSAVIALFLIFTHRKNIGRLLAGTENRIGSSGGRTEAS